MATVAAPASDSQRRDEAWARIGDLGERARHDRGPALTGLRELFASGRPSAGIDGAAEGRFVAFAVHPALDRVAAALARRWLPWSGKRFDAGAARGENLLLGGRICAFGFHTRVEPSVLHPGHDVLVIDYAAVPSNRWTGMSLIRDELVEVAPGAHLGQALLRRSGGRHALVAWWALRQR
jgi:hypothetical protein